MRTSFSVNPNCWSRGATSIVLKGSGGISHKHDTTVSTFLLHEVYFSLISRQNKKSPGSRPLGDEWAVASFRRMKLDGGDAALRLLLIGLPLRLPAGRRLRYRKIGLLPLPFFLFLLLFALLFLLDDPGRRNIRRTEMNIFSHKVSGLFRCKGTKVSLTRRHKNATVAENKRTPHGGRIFTVTKKRTVLATAYFPRTELGPSIIGPVPLNCRVRDGNGCDRPGSVTKTLRSFLSANRDIKVQ